MTALTLNGVPTSNGTVTNGDAHPTQKHSSSKNPSSYAAKFNLPPHFIGGNHLDAAAAGSVKDFVASHDGHTVITSVSFRDVDSEVPLCQADYLPRCSLQIMVLLQSKR